MWDRRGFLASASRAAIVRPHASGAGAMKRILWWVCLLLCPGSLIGLELFSIRPISPTIPACTSTCRNAIATWSPIIRRSTIRSAVVAGAAHDPDADGRPGCCRPAADGRRASAMRMVWRPWRPPWLRARRDLRHGHRFHRARRDRRHRGRPDHPHRPKLGGRGQAQPAAGRGCGSRWPDTLWVYLLASAVSALSSARPRRGRPSPPRCSLLRPLLLSRWRRLV